MSDKVYRYEVWIDIYDYEAMRHIPIKIHGQFKEPPDPRDMLSSCALKDAMNNAQVVQRFSGLG